VEWYLLAGCDEYSEYLLEHDLRVRQVWEDYYDADMAIHPEWPSACFKRQLMRAVLARMQAQCSQRGVPFVAVIVPAATDVCPDVAIRVDPDLYPTWSPTRLTDALAEILSGLEAPFVNLYRPFREAGPCDLYIGGGNVHWNAAGQDLAARMTAEVIRAQGLWPPRAR
jgi:hypothetical protein